MREEICEICENKRDAYIRVDNKTICLRCNSFITGNTIPHTKKDMKKRTNWVRVIGKLVDEKLINFMCSRNIYYNGNGYFKCNNMVASDTAISLLREYDYSVERCSPPVRPKLTRAECSILGFSLSRVW
jgi:hypothetical protein